MTATRWAFVYNDSLNSAAVKIISKNLPIGKNVSLWLEASNPILTLNDITNRDAQLIYAASLASRILVDNDDDVSADDVLSLEQLVGYVTGGSTRMVTWKVGVNMDDNIIITRPTTKNAHMKEQLAFSLGVTTDPANQKPTFDNINFEVNRSALNTSSVFWNKSLQSTLFGDYNRTDIITTNNFYQQVQSLLKNNPPPTTITKGQKTVSNTFSTKVKYSDFILNSGTGYTINNKYLNIPLSKHVLLRAEKTLGILLKRIDEKDVDNLPTNLKTAYKSQPTLKLQQHLEQSKILAVDLINSDNKWEISYVEFEYIMSMTLKNVFYVAFRKWMNYILVVVKKRIQIINERENHETESLDSFYQRILLTWTSEFSEQVQEILITSRFSQFSARIEETSAWVDEFSKSFIPKINVVVFKIIDNLFNPGCLAIMGFVSYMESYWDQLNAHLSDSPSIMVEIDELLAEAKNFEKFYIKITSQNLENTEERPVHLKKPQSRHITNQTNHYRTKEKAPNKQWSSISLKKNLQKGLKSEKPAGTAKEDIITWLKTRKNIQPYLGQIKVLIPHPY